LFFIGEIVAKRLSIKYVRSQRGGVFVHSYKGEGCSSDAGVRTFCCGKTLDFSKFGVSAWKKRGECRISFRRFCADVFNGRPL